MSVRSVLAILLVLVGLAGPLEGQRLKLPVSLGELEKRAKQDSLDAAAHYNVALAYWNEKRFDEAEASLRLAASIDPKFAEAPFLERVRARLGVTARPDSATGAELARRLAGRAAFVRWPPDAGSDLMLASDPDVQAALAAFPRLPALLRGPAVAR